MDELTEKQIREIIAAVQSKTKTVLLRSAEKMSELAARETVAELKRLGIKVKDEKSLIARVVAARMAIYEAQLQKGGSECVERILTPLGDGTYSATTAVRFVPWLSDKTVSESDAIIKLIQDGTDAAVHPYKIARQLDVFFEGTKHNSELVARTEAQKIRSDSRWDLMRAQGAEYFRYITAGDSRVRPEHKMRHGKIYAAKDCPYLGEYNCRCKLVPADRAVRKGEKVESSEAEIVTE